jgi:hypothetical protein
MALLDRGRRSGLPATGSYRNKLEPEKQRAQWRREVPPSASGPDRRQSGSGNGEVSGTVCHNGQPVP